VAGGPVVGGEPIALEVSRVRAVLVLVADSATRLGRESAGHVVVCGSHGGVTAARYAAAAGARAAIFNDAGVGRDAAGVSGLADVERFGMAAAAASHLSARIGDGMDHYRCGVISHANRWAREAGVEVGMAVADATGCMAAWSPPPGSPRPRWPARDVAAVGGDLPEGIAVLDSISQLRAVHLGKVVASGSHGGLVAGRAVRVPVSGAIFNDAGVGKDGAGLTRLALLDSGDVPAATVGHWSARIGDGLDTYQHGVVSHANQAARSLGVRAGDPAREATGRMAARRAR